MQYCLDARPEERTYNQLNSRRIELQEIQDDYSNFSRNIHEQVESDTDQTFLKERYIENEKARIIAEEVSDAYWPANRRKECKPAIPRQPEECWGLKLLLVRLSKELTEYDLETIKFLLIGKNDGDSAGYLQNASPLKVFDLLQTRNFVTSKDLLFLQTILAALGNESLIDMVYKYAQNTENVLHFDPPLRYTATGDHLREINVRGVDFRCYSTIQLDILCNRILRIAAVCSNRRPISTSCEQLRLSTCISCSRDNTCGSSDDLLVYEINEPCEPSQETHVKNSRSRHYVLFCDTGIQTDTEIVDIQHRHALAEENERLKRQLAEAKQYIQMQAMDISEMKHMKKSKSLETNNLQLYDDMPSLLTNILETTDVSESEEFDSSHMNKLTKDREYELNSLKKDNAVLNMRASVLSEESQNLLFKYNEAQSKYEETLSKYNEAIKENGELKVEKLDTEIQMTILQRNFDELKAKLETRIEEENSLIMGLRNELEMTTASLLNAQNDKRLYELTRCLEQIASMSMTVKKVYGNFHPAHEHISPEQDELFRKSLSGKIGRIYPQIYYTTNKR
ncbi:uncharacterized protein LOC123552837 [Mercenaria mercenaria]|uniref:uncharacterized protein LOC123552837 n=1 Tax=Mercenaria mercenaria TaxID=6596 RepID=UPI00234F18C6|nr:uncharacterized protein LOC123552837 [Mercenaria mercenaria]